MLNRLYLYFIYYSGQDHGEDLLVFQAGLIVDIQTYLSIVLNTFDAVFVYDNVLCLIDSIRN